MKNITVKIIVIVAVIIMCIPIISDIVDNYSLKEIKYSQFDKVVEDTSRYGFALLYVGDNEKDIKKEVKDVVTAYVTSDSNISVYFMDINELKPEEIAEIFNTSNVRTGYVFISNGTIIRTETAALDKKKLDAYVSEYAVVYEGSAVKPIASDLVYYKVAENAAEYKKLVNDKKVVTMAVFGRDNCFYCNQFKPVYNTVAEEKNLDIYYFDSTSYDPDEYQKVMDLGLKIPAACAKNEKESNLADGFDTPLTLFTKNGKVIDCISGYVNKENLIAKLETVGMIKSEE